MPNQNLICITLFNFDCLGFQLTIWYLKDNNSLLTPGSVKEIKIVKVSQSEVCIIITIFTNI